VLRSEFLAVEQVEAILCGDYSNAGLEPGEVALVAFAEKVALHAYQVTSEDLDNLRKHSIPDEEILDIILTAAVACLVGKEADATGFQLPSEFLKESRQSFGKELFHAMQVGRIHDKGD
jgi:alkylhydroperoxidase family enzyme